MKLGSPGQIFEKSSNKNFTKIRSVGAEVFFSRTDRQRDGRTEMTKLAAVPFRNFANVPKTVPEILPCVADYERRTK